MICASGSKLFDSIISLIFLGPKVPLLPVKYIYVLTLVHFTCQLQTINAQRCTYLFYVSYSLSENDCFSVFASYETFSMLYVIFAVFIININNIYDYHNNVFVYYVTCQMQAATKQKTCTIMNDYRKKMLGH